MSEPLTQIEKRVYHYMIDFLAENTYQPSIREIARQFRIKSTKTVSDLLHSLETKGYIEREESRSRGVRILGFSATGNTQPVPYYGQIHAGEPALLPEHRSGFITMDRRFLAERRRLLPQGERREHDRPRDPRRRLRDDQPIRAAEGRRRDRRAARRRGHDQDPAPATAARSGSSRRIRTINRSTSARTTTSRFSAW